MKFRTAIAVGLVLPVLYVAFLAAGLIASARAGGENNERCFPARLWSDESDADRPCVSIKRVYEDGSFKYAVYDADRQVPRYSGDVGVPDAYECKAGVTAACR